MSVANPAFIVSRRSVVGEENEWVKMFDPPNVSPATPERLAPTNPVPEVMAAAGFQRTPTVPHTVQRNLMIGKTITTWDGLKNLKFFVLGDRDNPTAAGGNYPAATIRVPRGAVFHGDTVGAGPPPTPSTGTASSPRPRMTEWGTAQWR